MTLEEGQLIQSLLWASKSYLPDKEFIYNLINGYKTAEREKTYELDDKITRHAIENKWSRRMLNALLQEIILEVKRDKTYSEDLYDLLTNYMDGLEGWVHYDYITRLYNDPVDTDELCGFVRGGKWIYQDYYSNDGGGTR